jgi:hypothetical protein
MTRRLVLLSCLALLAGAVETQAQPSKGSTYEADGFEVEFSGRIEVAQTEITPVLAKRLVRATNYLQEGSDFAYMVNVTIVRGPVNFSEGVKRSFQAINCRSIVSDTALPFPAGQGRELRGIDCHDGTARAEARYFAAGRRFYQVLFLIKKGSGDLQAARRFLESFKVIVQE